MKILVVAGGKGGTGKTSTAAHIAFYASEAGQRVLAIDFDTGNLSKTLAHCNRGMPASALFLDAIPTGLAAKPVKLGRLDLIAADNLLANLIFVPLEQASANLASNLRHFNRHYDLCVIDTAPGLGVALAATLHAADAIISPIEMEDYSIEGIKQMLRSILNARQRNPRLTFLGILPSRVDRRSPRQVRNFEQVRQAQGGLVIPLVVALRSSVAEALAQGVPVWSLRKTSARAAGAEMRAVGQYVLEKMGVEQ